jgi:hypothetical protein
VVVKLAFIMLRIWAIKEFTEDTMRPIDDCHLHTITMFSSLFSSRETNLFSYRKSGAAARMNSNSAARAVLAWCLLILALCSRMDAGSVTLAWNPSPDPTVAGYTIHYGLVSQVYLATADASTNLSLTLGELATGFTYYFAVSAYNFDGIWGPGSGEVSATIPLSSIVPPIISSIVPPIIVIEPSSQTAQAGAAVVISVDAIGVPPPTFQWFNGAMALPGETNSVVELDDVSNADAGNYTVVVSDAGGSVTSAVATVTVIDPVGATSGGLGPVLRGNDAPLNRKPVATSDPAVPLSSAEGTYNGLFYETNDAGSPAITIDTAGMLTNCVVDDQGNYDGVIYVAGGSYSIAGVFDDNGNGSAVVDRSAAGLSDLAVAMQVDLTGGTLDINGSVSNLDQGDPWTAGLTAELETNAFTVLPNFLLTVPATDLLSEGTVTGVEGDGVISLFGSLGDGTAFYQTAPISIYGNVPLFVPLNGPSGLLAGWVNAYGSPSNSLVTWISPPGPFSSGFTNIVDASVTPDLSTQP